MKNQISPTISLTIENLAKYIKDNKGNLQACDFSQRLNLIQKDYLKARQKDTFCSEAELLAQQMIKDNYNDFAGIIFSALCKLTQFIPEKLESFALQGLEVAEACGDTIHIMARLNELRKVYFRRYDKLKQYIDVLYRQEKCLVELTTNYDKSIESYQTIKRKAAQLKDYELMLAHVRTEIGKLVKKKNPLDAHTKLIPARETFSKRGYSRNVEYIDMLLREIQEQM